MLGTNNTIERKYFETNTNMIYNQDDKDRIFLAAKERLQEVIESEVTLKKSGASLVGRCPFCEAEKGFTFTPGKSIFKCFKCDIGGNDGVSFLTHLGKGYGETLTLLAHKLNVPLTEKKVIPYKPQSAKHSYCKRMLQESGLTESDVQVKTFIKDENKTNTIGKAFKAGTINSRSEIVDGDDVIIEYYDLEGAPVVYEQMQKGKPTGKMKEYFRVRWQFPQEHTDKNGRPYKYRSPVGSGSFIYIPQRIREIYKSGGKIERLFIQEGEKKAEKACKHGIPSVAISGIHNLARNGRLHEDLVKLIGACEVKELVFLFDADWSDISRNIGINDNADQRPRTFFYAAKNFKEYTVQLRNSRNIYLEVYIGHIKQNEKQDKGIDDLLSNTLKENPHELKEDVDVLINERSLTGKYIQLYKITTWSDGKLLELWSLHNSTEFAERHKEILKTLPEFRIGKHRWRFDESGSLESAQPIGTDEQFWEEIEKFDREGNPRTEYKFRYERCFRFLQNRGFARYQKPDGEYDYIHIEHPFVRTVYKTEDIRDFVKDFTREIANEEVLEMLHRGGPQFLGPEKLSNLIKVEPTFEHPQRDRQLFYFKEGYWDIRKDAIEAKGYDSITHQIWEDERNDIPATRTERLIDVSKNSDGHFAYKLSKAGKAAHFLQFLINTSNYTWRKEKSKIEIAPDELQENTDHLISKLCAIGYMMMSAKDRSVSRAVVAMDGKQSEVGLSNGRSGKSILGEMFKQVQPAISINGKYKDIDGDQFLWDEITVKTKVVFIDDVRTNFPVEFLFTNITGDWGVNYKGNRRATFPFHMSPKIYITTNHALNGDGSSFNDRLWKIAFSDFYNDKHKPIDDFGTLFFDDWDFEQWNLLWNLLAECVQLYLKYGVVQAPQDRIEHRQLRQFMGEEFISWAEEYFSNEDHKNTLIPRKEIYDSFLEYAPDQRRWTSATIFKKKIIKYCEWKGFIFNPQRYDAKSGLPSFFDTDGRPDLDHKSGGVEYFNIAPADSWKAVAAAKGIDALPFEPDNDKKEF